MQVFDLLPTRHDPSATLNPNISPHGIKVLVVDGPNVPGHTGKGGEIVAPKLVVVICHGICESSNDCFGDVYPD